MPVETRRTTCPMDCPDTCALDVTVEDGRVTELRGRTDHPDTAGFICAKVSRFPRRLYHEDRVLYPMRRTGTKGAGEFERITWDAAIAEITERFKDVQDKWGGEAILPYHYDGSNGYQSAGMLDDLFFARLGASRLDKTLCAAVTGAVTAGMYGKMPGVPFGDYPRAKMIIIWGANPKATNIHLVPYLKEAKRKGAFIVTVDPKNNFSNAEVDLHLPVFPGTDLPLALAVVRELMTSGKIDREFLEDNAGGAGPLLAAAEEWTPERAAAECGVPTGDIRLLAAKYAEASPAVIRIGWGLERNRNGGHGIAAVVALPALAGKFGVRGGGYTLSNSGAFSLNTQKLLGSLDWNTRELNMSRLGALLNGEAEESGPPVQALFVYNCNPVATAPNQTAVTAGLERADLFTVVHEQVMTDTARYADILLPATTFLEHYEVRRGYGSYMVGGGPPVTEPAGEARPNDWVFGKLGRAGGFEDEAFGWDSETLFNKIIASARANGKKLDVDRLAKGGIHEVDFGDGGLVQMGSVMPRTPDGKIHLAPDCLGPNPYHYQKEVDAAHPLWLISPSNNKMVSSTFGEFNYPELFLTIHPGDARKRDISDGATVRIFNTLGEVVCRAEVSDAVRPGVVMIPKGAWRKSSRNGQTANTLVPPHVKEVGGGACYNDARVEVEPHRESPR